MSISRADAYRGDIDGLRAVAVLGVVVFHLSPTSLSGGYIGVDMFFVISGYLITAQIRNALAENRFSFVDFYAKRIRRLYPALLATMLLTLVIAYFTLFPGEMKRVSQAMLATAFYVPNIYFFNEADYFSDEAVRPLLHTWSLGVEEQFYLVFPALLVLLARLPLRVAGAGLVALTVLSLAYAEYLVGRDASAAFYLSPTRFWEFSTGALLTFLPRGRARPPLATGQAIAGAAAVGGSMLLFSEVTSVPGVVTLLPVLGTALLIRAGEAKNWVSTALSRNPLRYIGTISYALYLVHWPLIVFTKALYQSSLPRISEIALLTLSIGLAHALTRYVERPVRRIQLPSRRGFIYAGAAVSTASVAMVSLATMSTEGFASRYPTDALRMAAYLDYDARETFRSGTCLINAEADREDDAFDEELCLGGQGDERARLLLIGDSFAAQFYESLQRAFPRLGIAQVTATGCRPLLRSSGSDRCVSLMRKAYSQIIPRHDFTTIILAARWKTEDIPELVRTVEDLRKHTGKVYVFGPLIEYEQPLPRLLALEEMDQTPRDIVVEARDLRRARQLDDRMETAVAAVGANVRYISLLDQLCDTQDCRTLTPSGAPTQFDYGHLTVEGASLILAGLQEKGRLRTIRALARQTQPVPGREGVSVQPPGGLGHSPLQ
jgi:peptidoglycan/LPS O-acetylase OafA/YrhL